MSAGAPERIPVELPAPLRSYAVLVGRGGAAGSDLAVDAVVADERVLELHGVPAEDAPLLSLPGGEGSKTFTQLERVLDFCAASGLSRRSTLMAYGGGTIGDLTGLAASLYKRGIDVVQVPTTLLAQVDASVGGKTAINLGAGKNLAGTFHHPRAVVCDVDLLGTLDDEDYRSGLGEVLKTAIIGGFLDRIEEDATGLAGREPGALVRTVAACVRTKAEVVAEDPDERGPRRALNLGHTFGHAIEHAAGYGRVPHGVAVGVGLVLAAHAAERHLGASASLRERLEALMRGFDMPRTLDELRAAGPGDGLAPERLLRGLAHDKKGAVGAPEFVLPRGHGDVAVAVPLPDALVAELLA